MKPGPLVALLVVWGALAGAARAQPAPPKPERPPSDAPFAGGPGGLPPGLEIAIQEGEAILTEEGDYRFTGPATITWRDTRIQADRMLLTGRRQVVAEGNVLLVWGQSRIFGSRLTYDLETERGRMDDVFGQVLDQYLFWADSVEKVGERQLDLTRATVTTCTQPVPYWSFSVTSATITIERYARMWNVRLRVRRAPVLYLPYLLWPVKDDRALGLLMPELGTTRKHGRSVTQELFVPLGRSADVTLLGRYFTDGGLGGGGRLRVIPNANGEAQLEGFFLNDQVENRGRYNVSYRQTQSFLNGFRMVADVNAVSDFEYYSDFERSLDVVSSPTILTRVEFSRNGAWTSLNVRELRREQLFADESSLIQQTLPEIEFRGRSHQLGRTPLYLSFESSVASIQQRDNDRSPALGPPLDADYLRGDVFPTLTMPWSRLRWLDVTPRVTYRLTHYTQRQLAGSRQVVDDSLTRQLWSYGVELVGPKLYRIWDTPESSFSERYKHTIEPRVVYGFDESFERQNEIVLYDEIDRFAGSGNQMTYGVVQRLFARRPRGAPERPTTPGGAVLLPDGTEVEARAEPGEPPAGDEERPREPVEIASFEISQRRSFDSDLRTADLDGDGIAESASSRSDWQLSGRFNPTPQASLDVRSRYDILFNDFADVSLSGNLRQRRGSARFSLVHRNGLGFTQQGFGDDVTFVPREDTTQVRLTGALSLLRTKLQLLVNGTWDLTPPPGQEHLPEKTWRVQYTSQCCTFVVERFTRSFPSIDDRRDLYFRVDLRGVGKLVDHRF